MIGAVLVQTAQRWIGPREVLQAAPLRMRVQFWSLVVSGVVLATVPVLAGGESMPGPNWTPYWPFVATVTLWVFSAGAVWAQFNALKERLSRLEESAVRRDKLDDKLELMTAKIDALHEKIALLLGTADWRDRLHGSKE